MKEFLQEPKSWLGRQLGRAVIMLGLSAVVAPAMAAITLNSVTLNGASSASVSPGATVTVAASVSLSNGTKFRAISVNNGVSSSCLSANGNSSGTYSFSMTAPTSTGTYSPSFIAYSTAGCSGASNTITLSNGLTVLSPAVSSMVRTGTTPTSSTSLGWTVTFNTSVTATNPANAFSVVLSGLTGTASISVTGSGTTRTVTATMTGMSGNGTACLNLVDHDEFHDSYNNFLGGTGSGNGNYSGPCYTVDASAPVFNSVTIASNNATSTAYAKAGDIITVTFSASDASGLGTPTATINGSTATIAGSNGSYTAKRTVATNETIGTVAFVITVRDTNNNTTTKSTTTDNSSVVVDRTAPTIPTATIATNNSLSTSRAHPGDVVTVSFTTSDTNGVSTPTVTISGGAAQVSGGPTSWLATRTVTTSDTAGTIPFLITVKDPAGNSATRSAITSGSNVTLDKTAPTVSAIACSSPTTCTSANPTKNTSVSYKVTFSESVTGVTASNFTLSGAGATGASIGTITGSGTVWTVAVNTGSDGALNLTVNTTGGLTDLYGNTLSAAVTTGSTNTYTIDKTVPTLSITCRTPATCGSANPTTATALQWTVTASETITGLATSNFSLTGTATAGATISSVTGSGTSYIVSVTPSATSTGTIGLNFSSVGTVKDTAGNAPVTVSATSSNTYTLDHTRPTATIACGTPTLCTTSNPTSASSVTWNITFSESVTGVALNNFVLTSTSTGAALSAVSGSGANWTVTATTGGTGNMSISLSANLGNIKDTAGNSMNTAVAGTATNTYRIVPSAPVASISCNTPASCTTANPTSATSVKWTVSFSSSVTGVAANNFSLTSTSTGAAITSVSGSGQTWTVTASTGTDGNMALNLSANLSNIKDANGVSPSAVTGTSSNTFAIDKTPPTATITCLTPAACGTSSPTSVAQVVWQVTFSDDVKLTVSSSNFVLSGTSIGASIASVAGSGTSWQVTANTGYGGTVGLNLTQSLSTIKNAAGLSMTASVSASAGNTYTVNLGAAGLNHIRVVHNSTASVCTPETITLQACADASCSTLYTGSVSVSLSADNSGTLSSQSVTFTGSGSATLTGGKTGLTTLAANVTAPLTQFSAICYSGGSPDSCGITFGTTGCTYDATESGKNPGTDIYLKVVGKPFSLGVMSYTTGSNGAVVNAAVSGQVTVTPAIDGGVGSCSTDITSSGGASLAQTVTLTNGRVDGVQFTIDHAVPKARIRITNNGTSFCSTDNFAVRPQSFAISTNASGVLTAGTGTGATSFTLNATAVTGYTGTPTLASSNFITPTPTGSTAGTLTGMFGQANSSGVASGSFTYSEVGYFMLKQYAVYDDGSFAAVDLSKSDANCFTSNSLATNNSPADPNTPDQNGKYGCYFGSAASSNIGRFIPHHFSLASGSIINRYATTGCTGSNQNPTFTYMGEAMQLKFTLEARNSDDVKTTGYDGTYAKLDPTTAVTSGGSGPFDIGAVDATSGINTVLSVCGATPSGACVTPGQATGSFDKGAAAILLPVTVRRPSSTSGISVYDNLALGINPKDSDNVVMKAFDLDTATPAAGSNNHTKVASTSVRYGRTLIDNAYGSELLDLSVNVAMQYWDGTGFRTNTLDNCTAIDAVTLGTYQGGVTSTNLSSSHYSVVTGISGGKGKIKLAKPWPTPSAKGSVLVSMDAPTSTFAPGSGRLTFGVYKAGPVIYFRERF